MNKLLGLVALLLVTVNAQAQSDTLQCNAASPSTTTFYFSNGAWTGRDAADEITDLLEATYKATLESLYPGQTYNFATAYNFFSTDTADLRDIFNQREAQQNTDRSELTNDQLMAIVRMSDEQLELMQANVLNTENIPADPDSFYRMFLNDNPLAIKREVQAALETSIVLNSSNWNDNASNRDSVQLYRNDIIGGQRVAILGHAQGALSAMANLDSVLLTNFESVNSISTIGVASPTSQTTDNVDDGLTFVRDENSDYIHHDFLNGYFLQGLPSRSFLDNAVAKLAEQLIFPTPTASTGALRVTLEWGAEPDVDLHLFEPDGTQVYYGNRFGSYGFLDVDDTTGFGPENYFISCDNVGLGQYTVGVNYYRGVNPETARVQVSLADGQIASSSILLNTSLGTAGNSAPILLFRITVTEIDGLLQFIVEDINPEST